MHSGASLLPWRKSRKSRLLANFIFPAALALLLCAPAHAQRRDFPASYRVTGVSQREDSVQLTLSLTVHNFSGKDISDCAIVLSATDPRSAPIGAFDLIQHLPAYRDTTVSHRFTLSAAEYAHWLQGTNTNLHILLPDGHGGTVVESIDPRRDVQLPEASE